MLTDKSVHTQIVPNKNRVKIKKKIRKKEKVRNVLN